MKSHLQALLAQALASVSGELKQDLSLPSGMQIDAARDPRHGDFATNLALVIAKPLGKPPRVIAQMLLDHMPASEWIEKTELAGPGFINFFMTPAAFQVVAADILREGKAFGRSDASHGKILVEYVSANPTGPMHVGHGRGAAYGDSLANILQACGWDVHREYYVNDAGRQVDILTVSVWLRYLQACGETFDFPARGYPSDYIRETSDELKSQQGDALRHASAAVFDGLAPERVAAEGEDDAGKAEAKNSQEALLDGLILRARSLLGDDAYQQVQKLALEKQLAAIRSTLENFGVRFDQWYSERSLVESGFARTAIDRLREGGHVFENDGATWLRTSELGDEKDRVLFKADGAATYFANDLAYHVDKLDRGYPLLLDVWGADHHGYIARVRAAIEALTGRKDALRVQLMQFVTLSSGRMGKRSGNFVTLQDLISEAGKDATRFFYLMRSHDQHLEFDIELARSQSNDNPVYYVQYAHARICSVFRQLQERGQSFDAASATSSLHRLIEPQEKHLLTVLQRYAQTLQASASQYAPHLLAFYLRDLADALHSYYNAHKFLVEDAELQTARLALITATRQVLVNGLDLLGVSQPESM